MQWKWTGNVPFWGFVSHHLQISVGDESTIVGSCLIGTFTPWIRAGGCWSERVLYNVLPGFCLHFNNRCGDNLGIIGWSWDPWTGNPYQHLLTRQDSMKWDFRSWIQFIWVYPSLGVAHCWDVTTSKLDACCFKLYSSDPSKKDKTQNFEGI